MSESVKFSKRVSKEWLFCAQVWSRHEEETKEEKEKSLAERVYKSCARDYDLLLDIESLSVSDLRMHSFDENVLHLNPIMSEQCICNPMLIESLTCHCEKEISRREEWITREMRDIIKEPKGWQELCEIPDNNKCRQDMIIPNGVIRETTVGILKIGSLRTDVSLYDPIGIYQFTEYSNALLRHSLVVSADFMRQMRESLVNALKGNIEKRLSSVELRLAPLKTHERMIIKAQSDYLYKCDFPVCPVLDVTRCSLTFTKLKYVASVAIILDGLQSCLEWKNGFIKLNDAFPMDTLMSKSWKYKTCLD